MAPIGYRLWRHSLAWLPPGGGIFPYPGWGQNSPQNSRDQCWESRLRLAVEERFVSSHGAQALGNRKAFLAFRLRGVRHRRGAVLHASHNFFRAKGVCPA